MIELILLGAAAVSIATIAACNNRQLRPGASPGPEASEINLPSAKRPMTTLRLCILQ